MQLSSYWSASYDTLNVRFLPSYNQKKLESYLQMQEELILFTVKEKPTLALGVKLATMQGVLKL